MTVDAIYDNVKKNGIPVGLDAWLPKEPEEKEALEHTEMYFG